MTLEAVDVADLDPWTIEWARSLDVAADAWRPELELLIDRLGAVPGRSIVDVGCGSGRITGWLADRVGADGLVCAVDREAEALEYAAAALSGVSRRSVEDKVRRQAEQVAKKVISRTQANMAMEKQALSKEAYAGQLAQLVEELSAKPGPELWEE